MTERTTTETLVFRHPFRLRGWPAPHPAGTYALEVEEEMIEGLSFPAWRRIATTLTRAPTAEGHTRLVMPVDPREVAEACAADRARPDTAP